MRARERWALAAIAALTLAAGALASDVARRLEQGGRLRLELGRHRPTALAPATVRRMEALTEPVRIVHYVSPPSEMPAEMRRLGTDVADLMQALERRFPGKIDFQSVEMGERPGLEGFAARRRVAPFRLRTVTRDAWSERTVWSTLVISWGARPEARIRGLRPEQLPELQALLVAWLDELEAPRLPHIALAAPAGFDELVDELAQRGEVEPIDLDGGASVPEVDLLCWMRPRRVDADQLRGLERLLARGGSVLIAGGLLDASEDATGKSVTFTPRATVAGEIASHFGLRMESGLLCDPEGEEVEIDGVPVRFPHWVRSIAPDQDFHRFASQPNGTLIFRAASPLVPEPARLADLGRRAEVLATTTDRSWLQPVPDAPSAPDALVPAAGESVPKQALLVDLVPDDPRAGELFFAGSDSPFADGFLTREHAAHRRLVQVLVEHTTSAERRVLLDVPPLEPELVAAATSRERVLWRGFVLGLPLAAFLGALLARARAPSAGGAAKRARRSARPFAAAAAVLVLALAATSALERLDLGLDATADGSNALAPLTRTIAARAGAAGPTTAELFVSDRALLPPRLRAALEELPEALDALERAGARLERSRIAPEDLGEDDGAELARQGIAPFQAAAADEEVTRVSRFFASLRLTRDGRTSVLSFPDERALERLEFRLVLALLELEGRPPPRVAFASDVPRLSAAEAYEQYQQKSLFAPRGTDVYALARESLAANGLAVTHVNPRAPELPEAYDVLVWVQPRRSIEAMLAKTVRALHGGKSVLLAAQHFQVLPQQFRGGDFEPRYWPRPETPDVDLLYFPELSIELVREVLFDELATAGEAEAQLTGRQGARDFERQASALPFQIRVPSASANPASPVTRRLGDQSFPFANRLRWDEARLAERGITATTLLSTSGRTWSFAWKGGWIPEPLLEGPAELEGSSGASFIGPQPLAVLFEGTFPRPTKAMTLDALRAESAETPQSPDAVQDAASAPAAPEPPLEAPWPEPAPGKLLYLGCSQFLTNQRLLDPEFRGDQLLWNAVTSLAFEPDMAELAARERAPRGFGYVEPSARLALRAAAIGGGPAALIVLAAAVAAFRARGAIVGRSAVRP